MQKIRAVTGLSPACPKAELRISNLFLGEVLNPSLFCFFDFCDLFLVVQNRDVLT